MLNGHVTGEREAVVPVEIHGPAGQTVRSEAVIDTGYNGFLTLSPALIEDLGLAFAGTARAALGDGSEVAAELYLAALTWQEQVREVLVLAAEGGTLLGMAMLAGSRVVLEVEEGGRVTIEPL